MTDPELAELLRRIKPFSLLTEVERIELLSLSERRAVTAKQILFAEGDEADAGWLVLSGRVAMIKSSMNGRELITELLPAEELFGIVAFIDARPYPLAARAQCDGVVLRIPKRAVAPSLERHPELVKGFIEIITGRVRASQNLARSLAHDKVETRICSVLLALVPRFTLAGGMAPIQLGVGRQELADSAGTTIETASRVIKALERDGIVDASTVGQLSLLNLQKLSELSEA